MIWSRLWLTLLTLLVAALLLFALVAPRPIARALDDEARAKLERAQQASTLLLRLNARKWMDTAAQVATDAILTESLEQATRGPADLGLVHKTVQQRLRYFYDQMHIGLVLATDGKGRVIARAGIEEGIYRDLVDGVPLISDGLRGLRGDDTWSQGGRLYRVAASPVIARDRYVGVLVIGQEVTSELAQTMKGVLGVEVAFLLRGRVLASSSSMPLLQALPSAIAERAAELIAAGSPLIIPIEDEDPGHLVILSVLPGEAAEHQALCALVASRPRATTTMGLLSQFRATDLRAVPLPLLGMIGGLTTLFLLIGFLIIRLEAVRPARRLARADRTSPPLRPRDDLATRYADTAEGELRQVFSAFLATRVRCGESTNGITFDKFHDKLCVQQAELISRHAWKGVRFQVYVKDGKAALKATPVS